METISVRQFLREPKKYIKPGEYCIKRYGKPFLLIQITQFDATVKSNQVIKDTDIVNAHHFKESKLAIEEPVYHYACGCEKVGTRALCPKHDRL